MTKYKKIISEPRNIEYVNLKELIENFILNYRGSIKDTESELRKYTISGDELMGVLSNLREGIWEGKKSYERSLRENLEDLIQGKEGSLIREIAKIIKES